MYTFKEYTLKKYDNLNWVIIETRKVDETKHNAKRQTREVILGYYSTFRAALSSFVDKYAGEAHHAIAALDRIDEVQDWISEILQK